MARAWRPAAALLAGFLALSALAADSDATPPEQLTLHLWNIPPKGSTDVGTKADRAVFDLFLQRNPHIKVKVLVPLKIQGPATEGNEFLAVAGGMAPDVFWLYGRKVGDYIDQGFLAPLNDRFKADFATQGEHYVGIDSPDKIWELCVRDGNIYAVAKGYYFMALQYRRDLFTKAGLDPAHGPRDWDELWKMGKTLTFIPSKEPGSPEDQLPVYGFALLMGPAKGWHFLQYVWSGGAQVVRCYKKCPDCEKAVEIRPGFFPYKDYGIKLLNDEDYNREFAAYQEECSACHKSLAEVKEVQWRLTTDEEGGVAALEFYRKMANQPWLRCLTKHEHREFDITPEMERGGRAVCPVCGETYELAAEGVKNRIYRGITRGTSDNTRGARFESAMQIMTLGEVTNIDLTQWSLTVFPPRPGHPVKSFIAGHYFGINRTSPPERQEAAWQYIKFVTGEEAQQVRVKAMVENGMAQYVRPVLLQKYGYLDYYRDLSPEWIKIYEEVSRTAEVEPYCKGFTHVMTVKLGEVMDKAMIYPDASCEELMAKTCEEVNTKILGKRPEAETRRYEKIAYAVLAAAAVLLCLAFWYIVRARMGEQRAAGDTGHIPGMSHLRKTVYAWSFLAVALLSVAIWQYYPLLRGSLMAFQDYKILSGGTFIGPHNFIEILLEKNFYQFLYQTFLYVAFSIAMGFLAPLILAVLLSEIQRGSVIFRTIYYLPAVTTGLVTMFLWKQLMYDPTPDGALNSLLAFVGIPPQTYLESPALAMVCIIIPGIWAGAGPGCLIYLAAFKCIPDDQYEAADLDGAGFFRKIWYVMVPNIKALILINFLGAFVGAFQASENIFVMTGGGPVNKTMTVGLDIWYHSFLYLNFGYATAEAWILGAMLIGFTVLQLRILSKVEFKRAGAAEEKK
jgi:ABC-type sugar transport system permease subunit/ABC-type glycerol-3-phosphate transport system substrate-binding protein